MTDTNRHHMKQTGPSTTARFELRDISSKIIPSEPTLGLVHVTSVGSGNSAAEQGKIQTNRCSVFNKDLVYAFVGRPAYRLRHGHESSSHLNRFPFVFIIRPEKLGSFHHVYPFDTGAALSGQYGEATDEFVFLEEYKLDCSLTGVQKHIEWAFGNNMRYFDGLLRSPLELDTPAWKVVINGFLSIANLAISGSNISRPDTRASAIEVAMSVHVNIMDHVSHVICPMNLIEDKGEKILDLCQF